LPESKTGPEYSYGFAFRQLSFLPYGNVFIDFMFPFTCSKQDNVMILVLLEVFPSFSVLPV